MVSTTKWGSSVSRPVLVAFVVAAFLASGFFAPNANAVITSLILTAPIGTEKWSGVEIIMWDATTALGGDNLMSILLSTDSGANYNTLIASNVDATLEQYLWD
ncbi:MAG: hypothetical protein AAB452_01605, partial [Patescibacteria group bacterium]